MKHILTFLSLLGFLTTASVFGGVYLKYYNKDSRNHKFDARCSGSSKSVEFRSSTTGATTIQGSGPCEIKAKNGTIKVKGGEKLVIKDGKIKIQ